MFVHAPVISSVSAPRPRSRTSSRVWKKPFMRIFSTTWSPSCGSSPSAGAAPHEPRTSASASLTPWNSGAFCFRPTAPGSTMYQTWITGTPFARHAAARSATLATAFWAIAWAGAPESANAPPSMITSFCMSWMISAQRPGSSCRSSTLMGSPHVGQTVTGDLARDPVQRGRRGDEQPVPVRPAPVEVADRLGHLDGAELLALRVEHAHAARARDPDVAALVELHPVHEVAGVEVAGADAGGQHAAIGQRAVRGHVEDADVAVLGVVDVQQRLVGREAQAVGLAEVVHQQLRVAALRRDPVDALEGEVLLALDAEPRHPPVSGVGEVDRAVALDDDVVGAVELAPLVVAGQDLPPAARAVGIHPHDRARDVLAHDQAALVVERHAVALVGGLGHLAHARALVPAPARVARHVAEQQEPARGVPDRALREGEPGPQPLDLGVLVDQLEEGGSVDLRSHLSPLIIDWRGARERNRCRVRAEAPPSAAVPAADALQQPPERLEAGEVVAGDEAVDRRQRRPHARGERLVGRAPLDR